MKALSIFKEAGLEDLLTRAKDGIQSAYNNSTVQDYIKPGLMGAGLGAAGMGLSSLMGGEEDETGSDKLKRVLGNSLKGAVLGGAAGVGGKALYDQFGNPNSGLDPQIAKLQNDLQQRTGGKLDTEALGVNHPFWQAATTLTHQSPWTDAAAGAGLGVGVNAGLGMRGRSLANDALADSPLTKEIKQGKTTHSIPTTVAERLQHAASKLNTAGGDQRKQRAIEHLLSRGTGDASMGTPGSIGDVSEMTKFVDNAGVGPRIPADRLDYIKALAKKVSESGRKPSNSTSSIGQTLNKITNSAERSMGPFVGRQLGRYGLAGGVGALGGMAAGKAGRLAVDGLLAANYPREQIEAWSRM